METLVTVWAGCVIVLYTMDGASTSVVVEVYADVIVCVSVAVPAAMR